MKLLITLPVLTLLFSSFAIAAGQGGEIGSSEQPSVYRMNEKVLPSDLSPEYAREVCVTELKLDPKGNVANQVIEQLSYGKKKIVQIEESRGSSIGGGIGVDGDYLTRVYIVKSEPGSFYKWGVYTAVTVTQYGKRGTNELKGLEVSQELLNYKHSAELAEGSECNRLVYIK